MKRYFRRFPPIKWVNGNTAHNNLGGVSIGIDDPHRAAVLAQEVRENTFAWLTTYLPVFGGLLLGVVGSLFLPLEVAIGVGLAIMVGAAVIGASKPVRAYRGIRGQVTEAVASVWLYGSSLEDEIQDAAGQLKGGYASIYGLEKMSIDQVEAICWRLVPDAQDWVRKHRTFLADGFAWLEGRAAPSFKEAK